jgi:hypothetical protein
MAKGFDTPGDPTSIAAKLVSEGYTFVAMYYFKSSAFKKLLTKERAAALSNAGLYIVSVFENGYPTRATYFTAEKGLYDATWAVQRAQEATQPQGSPIYFTVDYQGTVKLAKEYFRKLSAKVRSNGYKVGVYGSGEICKALKEADLVDYTWLSQSTGFPGYTEWKPKANIVQGKQGQLHGLDVDVDTSNPILGGGGWKI